MVLGLVLAGTGRGQAEEQTALQDRMRRAAELTSLDQPGTTPWHLKLGVEFFGENGKSTGQGSIEEWWASPTLNRVVYTVPGLTWTELRNADGFYRSKSTGEGSAAAEMMLRQAVHPMAAADEVANGTVFLHTETFGKVKLDCLMLGKPLRGMASPPLGLFPTYCMDEGRDSLRLTYDFGSLEMIRNRMGTFQKRTVSTDIALKSGDAMLAKASVETLKTESLSESDFVPGADLVKGSGAAVKVGSAVVAGLALSQARPIYPSQAKRDHVSGSVVLRATIGTDGHVHSLEPMSYPEADLAVAAIAAVRKWVYKPYLLNGEPVAVDSTITVNFKLAP